MTKREGGNKSDPMRVSLGWQILLISASFGIETAIGFFQIFAILFLRYVGVPLYLVSLDGIITVVFSLALIPLIGYLTDKGANPKMRKMVANLIGMFILLLGATLIITASTIKLFQEGKLLPEDRKFDNSQNQQNTTSEGQESTVVLERLDQKASAYFTTPATSEPTAPGVLGIPVTAILGICGVSLLNIGYDTTSTSSRAFMVVSVPSNQRMEILATAAIMQAISGNIFSLVGVIDLSSYLEHLLNVDGLVATYIVFASYIFVSVLVGFVTTCISSHVIGQRLHSLKKMADIKEVDSDDLLDNEQTPGLSPTLEDAVFYNMETSIDCASIAEGDNLPLLKEKHSKKKHHYASIDQNSKAAGRDAFSEVASTLDVISSESKFIPTKGILTRLGLNEKLLILSLSFFFNTGAMFSFLEYLPNVLTVGIYHGDPNALPGTEGHALYEKGQRMASLGNLIFYFTLLLMSLGNKFVLKYMTPEVLNVVLSICFIITLSIFVIVKEEILYFVNLVTFGPFRTCLQTLVFVLATKYSQEYEENETACGPTTTTSATKGENTGKVMSLLGVMMPIHYFILSSFMGPVIDKTNNVWVPTYYSLANFILSLLIFCLLFVWKRK